MPALPADEDALEDLRADTVLAIKAARNDGNKELEERGKKLLGEIDDALDDLVFDRMKGLATRLKEIQKELADRTRSASSWPFGTSSAPPDHERSLRQPLPENDFEDDGPASPPPQPVSVPPEKIPQVNRNWSDAYQELWSTMTVTPEWRKTAEAVASKMIANQGRYASVVAGTSVPWWFVSVVHAMECSLRFDEHLHNGDPLGAQTVRVPKGRPPFRMPPPAFAWEESARDAMQYDKIDRVQDWSLPSVLYHWHRFNGINNEYKRRGIPTPYLWSGSQHYRKGKYVADGVFDMEATSKQVGAAILLRVLIDLKAVSLDQTLSLAANPAAANGVVRSLEINLDGAAFRHVDSELAYPGILSEGAGRNDAERRAVRHIQEWLNLNGFVTPVDGDFGHSTARQLAAYQKSLRRPSTGELDAETWSLLTDRLRRALAPVEVSTAPFEQIVLNIARQHIGQLPAEIGGNNRGPWVRLYMQGREGTDQKWCAGFVCFIAAQAARDVRAEGPPFKRQVGVDKLVEDAKRAGRFISERDAANSVRRRSLVKPGDLFVVRASANDWSHVGFVLSLNETTFDTLEGNTGGDGGTDGANATKGNRSYANKDFIRLMG